MAAACSGSDDSTAGPSTEPGGEPQAIELSTSVVQQPTRSGQTANIDLTTLAETGFEVFASGGVTWTRKKVEYKGSSTSEADLETAHLHPGSWQYDGYPVMWPGGSVKFLAYAPRVASPEPGTKYYLNFVIGLKTIEFGVTASE